MFSVLVGMSVPYNRPSNLSIAGIVLLAIVFIIFFNYFITLFSSIVTAQKNMISMLQSIDNNTSIVLGGHISTIQALANETQSLYNPVSDAATNAWVIAVLVGMGLLITAFELRRREQSHF
jgi:preprotein translocase subunit YajC